MKEVWKDVVGFEGYYSVSNLGRVLSNERYIYNNGTKVLKESSIMAPSDNGTGYLQIGMNVDGKAYRKYVHRIVGEAFVTGYEKDMDIHHKDHNKKNNKSSNLEWVTRKDNIRKYYEYAEEKGTFTRKISLCECGEEKTTKAKTCWNCHVESNISIEEKFGLDANKLYNILLENSFKSVENMFGVSHTVIRRACQRLGIPDSAMYYRKNGSIKHDWNSSARSKSSPNKVRVDMLDMSGSYIRTFDSVTEASKYIGENGHGNIVRCINGGRKSCRGYKWRYTDK